MDKATVKGHGFQLGQQIEFYGMGKDLPSELPTIVTFAGRVGTMYQLITVTGEIMTWEFGASASIWAAPYYPVKVGDRVEDTFTETTYTVTGADDMISLRQIGAWRDGEHMTVTAMIENIRNGRFVIVSELGGKSPEAMADTEAWFGEVVKVSEATMTPEVGDTLYHERTGHQGVISDVRGTTLVVSWHDGGVSEATLPDFTERGYEVIPAAEVKTGADTKITDGALDFIMAMIENDMTLRGVQPRIHALPANTMWRMARGKRKVTRRQARRNHGARA